MLIKLIIIKNRGNIVKAGEVQNLNPTRAKKKSSITGLN